VRAIKEWGDGALGSRGAWLLEPYSDKPDSVGLPRPAMQGLLGRSPGRQVGPRGTCTSAAWSPDGRWMYFGAAVGGGSHLWRQKFPNGAPEQITFGPLEEEGVAVAPDGQSLVTPVETRQSAIWIHDAAGERPISSEGYAMLPRLSRDGTRVFYLLARPIAPTHTPSVTNWRLGVLPTVDLDELWT
jgi:hypothetical protein